MDAWRVISGFSMVAPEAVAGSNIWGRVARTTASDGTTLAASEACMVWVLAATRAFMIEMPTLDPMLRTKVKTDEPSGLRWGGRVAKANTESGTNSKPT